MTPVDWTGVKARHRLVDVARRSGLEVNGSGRVMVCCPLPDHPDAVPSAQLDLDSDRFHCFGCGVHGDVIDWVRCIEGVDAVSAVEILESLRPIHAVFAEGAVRYGRQSLVTQGPHPERTSFERVRTANELAWEYYSQQALHDLGAKWLATRGIETKWVEAESNRPVVGHTPTSNSIGVALVSHLKEQGFSPDELVDSGLATRTSEGRLVDFFRKRLILRLGDSEGRTVGLIGRDTTGRAQSKYLNPPSTVTYQKSRILYRPTIRQLDCDASVVVCEGPLDALAIADQAARAQVSGYVTSVAVCGTALSDHHVKQLLALHRRAPVLAADGDDPGRQANLAWSKAFLASGRESVITNWPDGFDPASWLAYKGAAGLNAVCRPGCLTDHSGALRPRHCALALTAAAFPDHDEQHPPKQSEFRSAVATACAHLAHDARRRFMREAARTFSMSTRDIQRSSAAISALFNGPQGPTNEGIDL